MPSHHYRRILAIINPVSGQQNPEDTKKRLRKATTERGIELEVRETQGEGDALTWAREAHEEGFDLILVSGGDGTVVEAMSGQIKSGSKIPLAQLPAGTASLFARALDIPSNPKKAIDVALDGPAVRLDVGYLPDHDRYFALVAGAGWDARLIRDAPRDLKRKIGFMAYVLTGIKNLFNLRRTTIEIEIDGKKQTRYAHTVMIANIGQIDSAGIAIGPDIWPHDGKLDAVIVASSGLFGIIGLGFRLLTRQFGRHHDLIYAQANRIRITTGSPLPVEIDGEPFGYTPLYAEAKPDAALIVVPQVYADKLKEGRRKAATQTPEDHTAPTR